MSTRPVHEFAIPQSLRNGGSVPAKVGLRALTADEEIQASKSGRFDLMRTQYEATKRAVCELDGKQPADGDVDKFWESCGPKLRGLVVQAYNKLSTATTEEEQSFFASETVRVA